MSKLFQGQFTDVMVVTELRGSYPNVPIASDVDYEALIAGDSEPMFLTLPIGKAGVTSGNKRHYDEAWIQELERQALAVKPVGLMGHLSSDERATAFPAEAIHWVGVLREQNLLWGKGYVPPGPVRERIRRYKAQGKALATSIDAYAEGTWDATLNAWRMNPATLKLAQIDLAPADRAGIPDLAAVPIVTKEMQDEKEQEVMDKTQAIREMTPEEIGYLPASVRQAILDSAPPAPEIGQVQTIRELLGLDANADLAAIIRGMKQAEADREKARISARIQELVSDPAQGVKVEAVRPLVIELISARQPQTIEEAERRVTEVINSEAVKAMLAAHVVAQMGPAQRTGVPASSQQNRYFIPPPEAA